MYISVRRVSVKSDGLRAHQLMLNNRITVTLYTINLDDNVQNSVHIMNYEIMFISHITHNVHILTVRHFVRRSTIRFILICTFFVRF